MVGLAGHPDARRDRQPLAVDCQDDDLAVALARHVRLTAVPPDDGEGIFAAGDAALGGIVATGPEIELGDGTA